MTPSPVLLRVPSPSGLLRCLSVCVGTPMTTDSQTWHVQPNGGGVPSISFVSPDDAWIVRYDNGICSSAVTHDDGKTWTGTEP